MSENTMSAEEKRELEELRRDRQRYLSEQGRLKKAQQELAETQQKLAELEQERQAMEQKRKEEKEANTHWAAISETMGEDASKALSGVIEDVRRHGQSAVETVTQQVIAQMEAREAAKAFTENMNQLNQQYGTDVLSKLEPGGELHDSWLAYKSARASVSVAESARDATALREFIGVFLDNKGIKKEGVRTPGLNSWGSSGYGSAEPNVYTADEYAQDLEALNRDLTSRKITKQEFDEKTALCKAEYEKSRKSAR